MTQNFSSSSTSADRQEADNQTSTEIRADIDQTRASVGEKIDQLQARLDPNKLKQQAQETVQEMISDTAGSMTEYVRVHKDEMVTSLADAARRNPLPTALVGLGIGWLILESMAGKRQQDDDRRYYEYERRNFQSQPYRDRYAGSTGRSVVSQGRGQYDYENDAFEPSEWGGSGYASNSEFRSGSQERQYQPPQSGNGHHQGENPIAKATGAVQETMSDMTDRVGDAIGNVKEQVSETMSDMGERVSDAMSGMRHQADQMGDQAQRWSGQAQRSMNRAGDQMQDWQRSARYEGERRGRQVARNLEDNPLIYGAVALAAGAAIGYFLPQTRTENRAFGDMRDQVVSRGQEVYETAMGHAQQVVEEVRPELEQKARQIVSDVTETGKQAVKDAAAELTPVVDKAVNRGKEEAVNAAKEMGVDPSQMMPGKTPEKSAEKSTEKSTEKNNEMPVINRDTLSGQWKQVKGEVKSQWGQLTDDDMTQIEGDYEKLVGKIQSRYGYSRERIERELKDFFNTRQSSTRQSSTRQSSNQQASSQKA